MMAGLGAFIAAGAAAGIGQGLVAQAKLDFEAAKAKAAQEARAKERAEDRDFQTKRDEQNFGQQLKLKDIDNSNANAREAERRKYEADEKQKDRAAAADRDAELLEGEDRTAYRVRGTKAEPVLDPEGKPIRKGLSVGSESANTYRQRVESAWEAGKGEKDDLGGREPVNLTKVVNRAKTLNLDVRSPTFVAEVQAELESQAAKDKGITDKSAWVQGRLRALGLKDPIAGGEAVPPRMSKPGEGAAAPAAKPSAVKEGTRAINRETGQTMVFTGGKWVAQ